MSEKTFEIYPEIKSEKVYFNNRFGIKIAEDLYLPADYENQKNPAIAVSGPFGGVKEQCSGLYAQEFARMGFVAVATASMYDMSRSISRGYRDSYTKEQRQKIREFLSRQRWKDAESGSYAHGPHEIGFDEKGELMTNLGGLGSIPEEIIGNLDPVTQSFWQYYIKRAYHPRSINSTGAWTQTTPLSFFDFDLMSHIEDISPRPVMLIAGENAHSRYYSEDVYARLGDPKELVIVPGSDHCDLYDQKDKIPFDKLREFFSDALCGKQEK